MDFYRSLICLIFHKRKKHHYFFISIMENKITEATSTPPAGTGNGWRGILFNICFILYYYFTYRWVVDETEIINSYGLSSPVLFSKTLGWIVLISLIAEPFAIFYKLSYENYRVKGPALPVPRFFVVIMFISRFFIRIVLFIAALESVGIELERGGTGAIVTATFIFVGELVFAFSITNKDFVGKVKPALSREIFTRFVLLNMLVLFAFLFNPFFAVLLKDNNGSVIWKIVVALLLFFVTYLPNTMVQFYSDWRASKTLLQKWLYALSFFVAFLSVLLFG